MWVSHQAIIKVLGGVAFSLEGLIRGDLLLSPLSKLISEFCSSQTIRPGSSGYWLEASLKSSAMPYSSYVLAIMAPIGFGSYCTLKLPFPGVTVLP
jgi:hypothetical protein